MYLLDSLITVVIIVLLPPPPIRQQGILYLFFFMYFFNRGLIARLKWTPMAVVQCVLLLTRLSI